MKHSITIQILTSHLWKEREYGTKQKFKEADRDQKSVAINVASLAIINDYVQKIK